MSLERKWFRFTSRDKADAVNDAAERGCRQLLRNLAQANYFYGGGNSITTCSSALDFQAGRRATSK